MVHLRIVAPAWEAQQVVDLLKRVDSAWNLIHVPGAATKPDGDLILVDVAREDASVIVSDLKELDVHRCGSIAIESTETHISERIEEVERRAPGEPGDAVVWEEVEQRTSESSRLTASFVLFMILAAAIATIGILQDSEILIVGAMVVGPEFGPIAGFSVALVERRIKLALESLLALAVGLPAAVTAAWLLTLAMKATGIAPATFGEEDHGLAVLISDPDELSALVAAFAGAAGVLSLTTAKSGALIGVLISVTTIPAAANIGLAVAYEDWATWRGSQGQLAINVAAILGAGVLTLFVQRTVYRRRRVRHLSDEARRAAGLPVGRSRRVKA
ncbi:MAG TPA: TIGR00341 family protein [Solirubrobacteraceae bacterium]|jgi:uncharacterized hydrophobic protein (TIGR00271 family)|nr:TIGR00341 family protein [Solirubrobacteraceae bacterium]